LVVTTADDVKEFVYDSNRKALSVIKGHLDFSATQNKTTKQS